MFFRFLKIFSPPNSDPQVTCYDPIHFHLFYKLLMISEAIFLFKMQKTQGFFNVPCVLKLLLNFTYHHNVNHIEQYRCDHL